MESSQVDALALIALVALALRLGMIAHRRSAAQLAIHGGSASRLFNYLSATCFAAILPTVLFTVLILHPENIRVGGIVWHPLILAVFALALGSLGFALLHAVFERGPLTRALENTAEVDMRGWTETDARTSGL